MSSGPAWPAVRGVLFDWGGTLSRWADVDLLDLWQAAARHIDADRADELTESLLAVEAAMWRRTETTQQSTTLSEVLAEAEAKHGPLGPFTSDELATLIGNSFLGSEALLLLGFDRQSMPIRSALRRVGQLLRTWEEAHDEPGRRPR